MEFVRPLEPILIIDDSKEIRDDLNHILTELGYEDILECENFDCAKPVLSEKLPNVIFLDITLPDSDGSDMLEFINQTYPHAHVIMCSDHNSYENVQNSWELGAKEFIAKPFNRTKIDFVMKRLELIE
jgi:two-component system, chemotaxis family, chemotaxis protein CheY